MSKKQKEQKKQYESYKALKQKQAKGEVLSFSERNVVNMYEKKRKK